MDAFLAELKGARLRKVAKASNSYIGDRGGARDEDQSFASTSSTSFTSLFGSGSGSGDSSFSHSFSIPELEGSSSILRGARKPVPTPANFLRSRLRKVHPNGTDSKAGGEISMPNIVSRSDHTSGSGSTIASVPRDSGMRPLWDHPSRTTQRRAGLYRTGTSKQDAVDLTMDDACETMDVVVDAPSPQNSRLKRKKPETSGGEPLRDGMSIAPHYSSRP